MSIRQQKWSAPRGAVRTHRLQRRAAAEPAGQAAQAVVQEPAPVGPSSSKRARGRRGAEHQLVRARREANGASSTASSSIATIRTRRRTSSWTRSAWRLPPIVRDA